MNTILNDLQNRYTAKSYDPSKKVSSDDLNIFLEALRLSASSINSQPWKFIVIESDSAKQRMFDSFTHKFQFNQPHIKTCSHIILFAHKTEYSRADYEAVIDQQIADGRMPAEQKEAAFSAYAFVELNKDEQGQHADWTKSQTYIALGNALHTLARLGIDSTTMEGIDSDMLKTLFSEELDGYECHVALAIGYHNKEEDYNLGLPKSRLNFNEVIDII
ncbi:nitroreductase family protein [Vibrio sp. RC27]